MRTFWRLPMLVALAVTLGAAGEQRDLRFPIADLNFRISTLNLRITDTVTVRQTGREIRIELPADILFDFDKAVIRDDAREAMKQAATVLRAHTDAAVQIEGHTDSKGNEAHNLPLSQRRAEAVRSWLADREGLRLARATTAGYAARRPASPNTKPDGTDDPDGRQRNRRVEIVIVNPA